MIEMKFCVTTNNDNNWILETNQFVKNKNRLESIMFQGNGYFGIRAASEEKQLNEKRDMFVSGTFDALPEEVTELPNLPDLLNMEIKVDGQSFSLHDGKIKNYRKYLNMKNGELVREFDWIIHHKHLSFRHSRFVSMSDVHLFVSKVEIISKKDDINLAVRSGIDGQETNSGAQHMIEGERRFFDGRYLQLTEQTQQSKINFAFNVRNMIYIDEVLLNIKPYVKMNRRQIFANYELSLRPGQRFTLVKYANVFTDMDQGVESENLSEISINNLKRNSLLNYTELVNRTARAWNNKVWKQSFVKIDAVDNHAQIAVNFARYQLAANTPLDSRMNIGAKGITGEGYKGHTFWDTEIFMLPYYTFTMPEIARNLLKYRYLGLEAAHKKAELNGYVGAQFPWEAASPSDGEATPLWASTDIVTGKPMKVWSGFIEQHVTSDIVYAINQYLTVSGDQEFADKMGYEIMLDAAKFWSSRLEYDQDHDRYEITNVIGPDEYKEHIDNNAFTNYMAYWCIQKAIMITKLLRSEKPEVYALLDAKLDLHSEYLDWLSKIYKIYLPQPDKNGVLPQDDTYLKKPIIDVSKYQSNEGTSNIFKDFNLNQVNQLQVTKQADVLLLLYLFDDLFDDGIKQANWDYYVPKTTHDSSLSTSIHAILANDFKLDDQAYDFFEQTCEIDLGIHGGKSEKGLHLAGLGGIWNMVVQGFGGVRIVDGKLRIEPHLPESWNSLQYEINWQRNLVQVTATKEGMKLAVIGPGIDFLSHGQLYHIDDAGSLVISVPTVEMKV